MQLHECLLLAVHPPTVDVSDSMLNANTNNNNLPEDELRGYPEQMFTNASTTSSQLPSLPPKYTQGSVLSMLKCIVHEWGTNSRTNFYIPPEHYAGYTYLCDECQPSGWGLWSSSSSARNTAHCHTRSNCHGHHPSAFVHAEQLHNLHPHHHDNSWYYSMMMMRANATTTSTQLLHKSSMTPSVPHSSPIAMTSLANNDSFHHVGLYFYQHSKTAPTTTTAPQSANNIHIDSTTSLMTTPYIHPSLELPVPPLHLPCYFGALCWSFALAGVLMLRLPQKWTFLGGSRRCMQQRQHHHDNHGQVAKSSRHWFPYRAFAWVLILWQVSSGFVNSVCRISLYYLSDHHH